MKKNIFILFFTLFFIVFLQAQEKGKDTLYFKYDNKYIKTYSEMPKHYYLDDIKTGGSGTFFLNGVQIVSNLKKRKLLCLKDFVHNPKFYNKKQEMDDNKLADYFSQHIVYLVRKNEYIQVQAGHEID